MVNRNFRLALMSCTAVMAMAVAPALAQQAQDAADDAVLNKIVVKTTNKTARQKLEKGAADTPLASETNAETIRTKEISSIKDLGNSTEPGVDYVASRPGAAGGLYIRGLGGARVAALVDGIPLPYFENAVRDGSTGATTGMASGYDSFDFSSLSAIDVVRGSDSSRIGSGALAGALLMRTLEPEDLIAEGRDWGGVVKTTYDSEDQSIAGSVAVAKRIQNTSILFQGGLSRGNERDNKGSIDSIGVSRTKPNPADFDQNNLLVKLRQKLAGGHTIGITGERFQRNIDSDLKTFQSTYSPYKGYDDTRRERVSLDYRFEADGEDSLIDAAMLTAYWQRLNKVAGSVGTTISTSAPHLRDNEMEENSFGLTGSAISTFETGTLSHEVRLSGAASISSYNQFLDLRPITSGTNVAQADIPDVDGKRIGLALEDRIGFADSGFSLTPGVRFDWYEFDPKLSAEFQNNAGYQRYGLPGKNSGSRFSPKLMAAYQVTPELEVFAQYSMSYRAPTTNELFLDFTNVTTGYTNRGNPHLKAETGQGFEIGANYEDGSFAARVTAFHNTYRNFIDTETTYSTAFPFNPVLPGYMVIEYVNLKKVRMSGIELKARKEFENGLFLHGSLAYTYGKNQETGEFIRTVAPVKSVLGIGYEQETWGVDLSTIVSAGMRNDNKANTFDAPGYGIANLAAWWEPEQVAGLRIQAGVYNIFDRKYWNAVGVQGLNPNSSSTANQPVDFNSEPGRSFKISLTKKF